jgi:hypothetical protein
MRRAATACGRRPMSVSPCQRMSPPRTCGGCSPMIERISVVLPMPLRPSSATTSPAPTVSDAPHTTWALP